MTPDAMPPLPLVTFDDIQQLLDFLGTHEIDQTENPNATARLFVNGDQVAKVFSGATNSAAPLEVVRHLMATPLSHAGFVVIPTAVVHYRGRDIGYTMPFVHGRTLRSLLDDQTVPFQQKVKAFAALAQGLEGLPDNVHLGDLHARNIMVTPDLAVRAIDPDGFTIDGVARQSCPMDALLPEQRAQLPARFIDRGQVAVSRDTDLYCLVDLLLSYLLRGGGLPKPANPSCMLLRPSFSQLDRDAQQDYLRYLEAVGASPRLIGAIHEALYAADSPPRSPGLSTLIPTLAKLEEEVLCYTAFMCASPHRLHQNHLANQRLDRMLEEGGHHG